MLPQNINIVAFEHLRSSVDRASPAGLMANSHVPRRISHLLRWNDKFRGLGRCLPARFLSCVPLDVCKCDIGQARVQHYRGNCRVSSLLRFAGRFEGQWTRRGREEEEEEEEWESRGSREGKKAGRRVIGKGGKGRTMRVSLNICPEVRRRLPFSFSFAYGVHIVRARCNRRRVPCKRDRFGNAS